MRFYFQDKAAGNFATKCIRVSSTATTQDVIETLAEKFRPDMRMLSSPKYSLYEVHVSGGQCGVGAARCLQSCCAAEGLALSLGGRGTQSARTGLPGENVRACFSRGRQGAWPSGVKFSSRSESHVH